MFRRLQFHITSPHPSTTISPHRLRRTTKTLGAGNRGPGGVVGQENFVDFKLVISILSLFTILVFNINN